MVLTHIDLIEKLKRGRRVGRIGLEQSLDEAGGAESRPLSMALSNLSQSRGSRDTRRFEAYWCLDAAINVPTAIALLPDARLNQYHPSKILQAISTAPDIEPYLLILKHIPWQFQQSFSEDDLMRSRLFKEVGVQKQSNSVDVPPHYSTHTLRDTPTPSSLGLVTLQNLACTRLLQTGQYADAIKLRGQFSSVPVLVSGSDADVMSSSSSSSSSAATKMVQERNNMIEALYSTSPSVERASLNELYPLSQPQLLLQEPRILSLHLSQNSAPLASAERENLASSRARVPRFGSAPPILPISSGTGGGGSGGSGLGGGRKNLTFNSSAFNLLNTSTSTALASSISGAGAAANTNQQQQQNPLSFSSSKRKPNAFYKHPPAVNNDAMPNLFSIAPVQSGGSARNPERQPRRNKGAGVDVVKSEDEVVGAMQADDEGGAQGRDPNARGEGGLEYSLFANPTGMGQLTVGGNVNDGLSLSTGSSSSKKGPRPPGAFIVDGEEDEDEDEDDVDMDTLQELPSRFQLPPLQIPTRRTRSSRKSTAPAANSISAASGRSTASSAGSGAGPSVSAASTASRVTSTSRGRGKKARTTTTKSSKKTVPGAMFEDDEGQTRLRRRGASTRGKGQARVRKEKEPSVDEEDEGEEEEQDRVAPLGVAVTHSGRTITRATRNQRGSSASLKPPKLYPPYISPFWGLSLSDKRLIYPRTSEI
ncbi:hypothetical protein GYMLUDRAFT_247659 [Collybiopsis luxurians FD-317 M1]|uniref:ELYS-like domain-containing protein n=1 Tax=Collybiopsis luxurians FD-317 M1 TaxID=944289 RepID=A0A0D0C2T6_9AGAR|nr:hypothetical protein GYMLUDRAFT_247659 [Collybiopsis luxurians FD-317 M1]